MMLRPKYTYNTHGNMLRMLNISDNEKVFVRMEGEAIRYLYDNHLGSACLELDEYGYIISYEEYHPFGTTSYRAGRSATEVSWKRYKYCGKERDEETGLYYYGARYYAAWLCRFVSCDPLKEKYPSISPYVYCADNPIKYIDPNGMWIDDFFDKTVKFLYSKGASHNIQIVNENGDSSLLSENELTPHALRNIGKHYAAQVPEISNDVNIWGREGLGSIMAVSVYGDMGEYLGLMVTQGGLSSEHPGRTSTLIDNYNNFKSVMVHEWEHYDKQYGRKGGIWVMTGPSERSIRELNAYDFQISHDTWKNTTREYQMNTISNIGKYIYQISNEKVKTEKLQYFEDKLKIKFKTLSDNPTKVNWKLNLNKRNEN